MKRASMGFVAAAGVAALIAVARNEPAAVDVPVAAAAPQAAPEAAPAPIAPTPALAVPWRVAASPAVAQLPAAERREAFRRREPEPTPRERAVAQMTQAVEADARLSPFLRAGRDIHLDQERQEKLVAMLRSRCAPTAMGVAGGAPQQADPREAMRTRAQMVKELLRPLSQIAGRDTGRLIAAAMRPELPMAAQRAPQAAGRSWH